MDNLCHTLCGLGLARLLRTTPRGTALLVTAANVPDVDIVVQLFGGAPAYLIHHRGITHALLGLVVTAALLAVGFAGRRGRPGLGLRSAFGLALLGTLSHFGLDALNSYGVRPWLPFAGSWWYGDVAFIVDPWLWVLFAAAAMLGAERAHAGRRGGDVAWVAFAALSTLGLAIAGPVSGRTTFWVPLGYGVASAVVVGLRWFGRRRGPGIARSVLGAVLLYLVVLAGLAALAGQRARSAVVAAGVAANAITTTSLVPAPGVPWRFACLVATERVVHRVRVDLVTGEVLVDRSIATGLDDALLERVRLTQEYRAWRVFSRLPYVERRRDALVLGDLRYQDMGWCTFVMPVAREAK